MKTPATRSLILHCFSHTTPIRESLDIANEIGIVEEDYLYADSFDQPRISVDFQDLEFMMDDDLDSSKDSMMDGYDVSN